MKKILVSSVFAVLIFAFAAAGCDNGSSTPVNCDGVDAATNTYNNAIGAILSSNCAQSGCHDSGTAQSGLNFSTYAASKSAFQSADVICSINHDGGCEPMPDGGSKLSDATIRKIECWAENGYPQ